MKFGLTPSQYQYILDTVVKPLNLLGANIWCYGSRARGNYNPFSDLDLMVESDRDLSGDLGNIIEQLENSNFPYKVDLVQFMHFAESYKSNYLSERQLFK